MWRRCRGFRSSEGKCWRQAPGSVQPYRRMSATTKESRWTCFFINEENKRCATTAKRVENPLSLHNGKCTPCSERVEREGVLMVKLKGKFVPIEHDEPFAEWKGTGKMKQRLPHFRKVCTSEHMCTVTGHMW